MEHQHAEADTGDVSSAQAVLLGALAPGVNVRIFTLRSLLFLIVYPFFTRFA